MTDKTRHDVKDSYMGKNTAEMTTPLGHVARMNTVIVGNI